MTDRKELISTIAENVHRMRRKMMVSHMKEGHKHKITPTQWLILDLLLRDKAKTVKEIATALQMSSSAVTQLLEGLITKKHVLRKNNPKDRRIQTLSLSSSFKKKIESMHEKSREHYRELYSILNDDELTQYAKFTQKIADHLTTTL